MDTSGIDFNGSTYAELKTELQISEIGSLFLALYQDERIIELIINYLKIYRLSTPVNMGLLLKCF